MEHAGVLEKDEQDMAAYLASVRKDLAWASSELSYIAHSMVGERSETTSDLLLSISLALDEDKDGLARYLALLKGHRARL